MRDILGWFRAHFVDLIMVVVLVLLGIVQGWLRLTELQSDAISYLDISHAIFHGGWKLVFNPFWGVGYPFLIAVVRLFFPHTPQGEWNSLHVTNLLIFLGVWAAFLYLLRSIPLESDDGNPAGSFRVRTFLKWSAFCIFVAIEMGMDGVHAGEPDLLVAGFFFLAVAGMLRLVRSPGPKTAVVLGCILGLGFWVKAIALPLSLIVLGTGLAALAYHRRAGKKHLVTSFVLFVAIAAPYVVGLSLSYGRFTLGEAGPLNYGFHVDLLPHWTNWQGGPLAIYGKPIHPTHEVMSDPNVFVFGEPYHETYPPFGNIAYWYEGYHRFFSPRLEAIGILRDGRAFLMILLRQPILYAAIAALVLLWPAIEDKRRWLRAILGLWPLIVPAIAGIGLYLLVHTEARYLSSFFAILYFTPFLAFALKGRSRSAAAPKLVLLVLAFGAVLNFAVMNRQIFENVSHRAYYTNNPEWLLAADLRQDGLKRGQEVAAVGGPNAFCEWAYMDGLRIVAEMGGDPYDQRHPQETSPTVTAKQIQEFWTDPALQQEVLAHFRAAGAVAVIAPSRPAGLVASEWAKANGAKVWVYRYE